MHVCLLKNGICFYLLRRSACYLPYDTHSYGRVGLFLSDISQMLWDNHATIIFIKLITVVNIKIKK